MAVEVFIHKMSEHMESAKIIRWLVKEGDPIQQYQILMEVETDKVVAELEAPAAGILRGIRPGAVDGAQVPVGETIAFIAHANEAVPALPPLGEAHVETETKATPPPPPQSAHVDSGQVRATPVARRVAKELGVDLSVVKGTGPDGRIKEEDVRAYVEAVKARATAPRSQPSQQPMELSGEWLDLTPAQRITGQRMADSIQTAPQFALTLQADMTHVLWLREAMMDRVVAETGERLSITSVLVKVVAEALKHHLRANASFDNGRIKLHQAINIGVASGSEAGLVVPVIKEADKKSLVQVTREIKVFQDETPQMRFSLEDLSDGTFTISNLGMYGVEQFNAILNPPQSAILAVGRVIKTPIGLPDDTIALRPMMSLTLTIDHRVMDGVQGAQFLAEVKDRLEKPYFLV
jgi:pyruvate dehydrogenase E2 component (dihydrolipoamide acetyltransferase)